MSIPQWVPQACRLQGHRLMAYESIAAPIQVFRHGEGEAVLELDCFSLGTQRAPGESREDAYRRDIIERVKEWTDRVHEYEARRGSSASDERWPYIAYDVHEGPTHD